MTVRSTAVEVALKVTFGGRRRTQRVYRNLYRFSLRARGFGAGSWSSSGEVELLRRLANQLPEMRTIFDVGANVGGWSIEAARLWPQAEVTAFEPAADVRAELVRAVEHLDVQVEGAALSDTNGSGDLFKIPGHSGWSSIENRDLGHLGLRMSHNETVPLITLDSYCEDRGISHIDFLKMDIEGHELSALKGAVGLLSRSAIDLIQFEFGGANIDSRTFLRDFVDLLGQDFVLYRVIQDGLMKLVYSEQEEIFSNTNYLAIRRDIDGTIHNAGSAR